MLSKTHFSRIRSLHLKKNRDAADVFIAEGSKVVMELLGSGKFLCRELIVASEWLSRHSDAPVLAHTSLISVAGADQLNALSLLQKNQEVIGLFRRAIIPDEPTVEGITLILDGIRDPGNLGTLIRTADWFGLGAIICSHDTVDCYNPKVVQSAMGSMARVDVHYADLTGWLIKYPEIPVCAAVPGGRPVRELGQINEGFLIIGSESHGIRPELLSLATQRVGISGAGTAESLNAAVAAGILLSYLSGR
jgi:TrmH family RNA methyltransferase